MKTRMMLLAMALVLSACGENKDAAGEVESAARSPSGPSESWPLVWQLAEGSCQNTEIRVLLQFNQGLVGWADPEACELSAGAWQSWGRDAVMPLHLTWVVPLVTPGHAERHGAVGWSREQKIAFINDMDNLIILDPVSTRERADLGPHLWVPLERFWCEYANRWERVKQRYQLAIPEPEGEAIAHMQTRCPAGD